ncbi:Lrp/AsnC family transcriptional regulator [Candidatus Woesearchaeota archaeon]|nr:Lrp/AsnC family transcriptional regulator [Candidatus Woesearchaeota archaeon]
MVNKKDLLVMAYLRQNARMKLTTMSRLTRMPVSTIFDRLKYHEGGLIKGNICLLDFSMLGFHTRAKVMLKIGKKDKNTVREYLQNNHNVNSIYKINNGYDFLAEVVFRNICDLEEFMDKLEEKFDIKGKEIHYIIDDIKREAFMSDPNTLELLKID